MPHTGNLHRKSLLAEMAAIVLAAVLIGTAWNHTLLYRAWTGQSLSGTGKQAQPRATIPLPLGLMQVKELYDRKEALFVDARDAVTFTAGHVQGAVSLPVGGADALLPIFISQVPPPTMLVVYCNGYDCHDSRELGEKLLRSGYLTVYVFEGGYPEWQDAGYPTERGKR